VAPRGAGGRGEVWRARDPRLARDVAIKVLPAHLAATPEARARLEREARTIAALNHPNICTLFDVGHQDDRDYLVMELVEGETLAQRVARGPLSIPEVLRHGAEISDALDKAHRQGLVHRDLKPGNIMLTKSGAKLLDFGLARATGLAATPGQLSQSPTMATPLSAPLTAQGSIVGTFQYMAPEQLEGAEADARSDIFALGAVLYEMVTGRKAFEGKSQASLIAGILERDPPSASSITPMSPPALDRLIRGCLAKDPEQRVQTAHDVKLQLQWIEEGGSQAGVPAPVAARRRSRERTAWILAAAAGVLALVLASKMLLSPRPEPVVARFGIEANLGQHNMRWPRISPNGKLLVYLADDSTGTTRIWLRPIGAVDATPVPGSENSNRPWWSPDSRSLAFVSGGQLKRIDVSGGPAQMVASVQGGYDGAWGNGNVIVFDGTTSDSLRQVAADGGEVAPASRLDHKADEIYNAWPVFLPDGKHFLFLAGHRSSDVTTLKLGTLGTLDSRAIGPVPSRVEYAPPGYVLYVQDGTLMARPFDANAARFAGGAFPVRDGVWSRADEAHFSVSNNGVLASRPGVGSDRSYLVWVDRAGHVLETLGSPDLYRDVELSPDGTRLAYGLYDPTTSGGDIWVRDLRHGIATRVTFDPADEEWPVWSPDGKRIAYTAQVGGIYIILARASDGTGPVDTLYRGISHSGPIQWSPNGPTLLFESWDTGNPQMRVMTPTPGAPARHLQDNKFVEYAGRISPDGHWLAYTTTETGRNEVFVQAFPGPGGKWRISTSGGNAPTWRADGKELYYKSTDGNFMAVPIRSEGAGIDAGTPVQLFLRLSPTATPSRRRYDVTADGKRFVVNSVAGDQEQGHLDVAIGWTSELKRR